MIEKRNMNTPTLIILGGFAGSGKTTIAKKLAGERSYPFFSTDDYNAKLMSLYGTSFHETAPNAHELTWHIVKKNLEAGVTCILDTNMCSDRSWKNLDTLRNTHPQVHVIPILLTCSLETHRSRIEKRGKEDLSHLNLGGDKLEEVLFKYEYISNLQRDDIIRIDANGTIEDVYQSVVTLVD